MVAPLAPNRIHSLPVQVSYHLQSSSQTFSTLFPTPQQVYVHPSAGLSSKVDGEDPAWGAIYLKAVVQGIVMASPEVHPKHPQTPDLSLYVLDPRETFLRRSRAVEPLRAPQSGSHEVWTGKGLLSWALDEPGVGKNLITGRLCRRREFNTVMPKSDETMSALEALQAAHCSAEAGDAAWGIEISVGLKSSMSAAVGFPGPLHHTIESGEVAGVADVPPRVSPIPAASQRPKVPLPTRGNTTVNSMSGPPSSLPRPWHQDVASSSAAAGPSSMGPATSSPAAARSSTKGKPGRKKKQPTEVDLNLLSSDGIKPENVTPEQAQRLLANPTFVSMLKNIVNAPAPAQPPTQPASKRARVTDRRGGPQSEPSSRPSSTKAENRCWNCNTTRSSVWRTKQIEEGKVVRVCNACGLYFNKKRVMRPDKYWNNDDTKNTGKQSSTRADRVDGGTFKRTLTMAANKDAQRIANLRSARKPDGPMTSPARGSAAAPKGLRNSARIAANATASSPGWTQPADQSTTPVPTSSTAVPAESPGAELRRVLGKPALAMPLSDDGNGTPAAATAMDWNADLSSFFNDVDGFAMPPATERETNEIRTSPVRQTSVADINGVSSATKLREELSDALPAQSEDDVFSELFNRTSSFGQFESSPTPFDFSQLPPSSPPALPSTGPHSALLYSSPSGSPLDPSPRDSECGSKVSPQHSNLRHSVTAGDAKETPNDDQAMHELFTTLTSGPMTDELLALFASFPTAT